MTSPEREISHVPEEMGLLAGFRAGMRLNFAHLGGIIRVSDI